MATDKLGAQTNCTHIKRSGEAGHDSKLTMFYGAVGLFIPLAGYVQALRVRRLVAKLKQATKLAFVLM